MGGENQDGEQASKEVTVVVHRKIKPGCEKDYDEWLRRFLIPGRKVPQSVSGRQRYWKQVQFNSEAYNSQI